MLDIRENIRAGALPKALELEPHLRKVVEAEDAVLPKGIHRNRALPDPTLDALWESIVVEDRLKSQLLAQGVLNFTLRPKVERSVLPLHGVILLVGPPGTGKTSLAKGLASRIAGSIKSAPFRLLEVEPHGLTSSALGKTQRAVSELFSQSIAEAALAGPTIVLLDEVETLVADRTRMSLEANPIDVHRATDAVLVALDDLAEQNRSLLFLATSNFPQALDHAFTSRCDLVLPVPLPGADVCARILRNCLEGLERVYPKLGRLLKSPDFGQLATECVGLDGRAIRKAVANAFASSQQTAMDPGMVTMEELLAAARAARSSRVTASNEAHK